MNTLKAQPIRRKRRAQLIEDAIPQIETFIESRESYIKALEKTIQALKMESAQTSEDQRAIRSSADELVAMQRLSNIISTTLEPEIIVGTLIDLTRQVIPVLESNVFLFHGSSSSLLPLSTKCSPRLQLEAQQQLEAGIIDWVIEEKRTVIFPDLAHLDGQGAGQVIVIVPLLLRNEPLGVYLISSEKHQETFSNQEIQLLTVLANQAAAGVENWRKMRELVRINKELSDSQAQVLQAAKLAAIGELAASIVHEIKNPVQVLMMHIEMVQRGKALPNWVDLLSQQVARLSEITRRLMNFSRDVADDLPMSAVSVNRAIADTVAIVENEYRSDNIMVELSLDENIPTISGNTNYLQQVFLNLLINARDAMPHGGKIIISSVHSGQHIIIRFSDTGVGIEKEHLERVFQAFFTTKQEGSGTGLGLSICQKIISQHEGKLRVESEIGAGTTFTITLPVRRRTS